MIQPPDGTIVAMGGGGFRWSRTTRCPRPIERGHRVSRGEASEAIETESPARYLG